MKKSFDKRRIGMAYGVRKQVLFWEKDLLSQASSLSASSFRGSTQPRPAHGVEVRGPASFWRSTEEKNKAKKKKNFTPQGNNRQKPSQKFYFILIVDLQVKYFTHPTIFGFILVNGALGAAASSMAFALENLSTPFYI